MAENPCLFIIEDHPLVREGLTSYFSQTGRWQVTGSASCLEDAKEILSNLATDIILLDIQLEDGWGLDIVPWLKMKNQNPALAVYSAFDDYAHVSAALGMGVHAYVCKRQNMDKLEQALFKALKGENSIDSSIQTKLNYVTDLLTLLTKRESEIFNQVKKGLSNKEIAIRLNISHRTVENILCCIYDKTGIKTRLEMQKL